jgi:aspartate aminotransferase
MKEISATVAMHSLVQEKKARGETIYHFAAGDPLLDTPSTIIQAVSEAIQHQPILYPPVAGIPDLRASAAAWVNHKYGCQYALEHTLITPGGKFALFAALQHLLQEGDEVLFVSPYWVSYPQIVRLFKAHPVVMLTKAENQWKLTPDLLQKHLTARSKILILNNAGNPTGTLYQKKELIALMEVATRAGLFVISDEVYSELVYDQHCFYSCGALAEQVLVIQSCSKNFAMTGWRVGFAFGPEPLIQAMTALQGHATSGPSIVSQWAALAALSKHDEITDFVRSSMQKRRRFFMDTFNTLFASHLPYPPSTLYAFIPLSIFNTSLNSTEFCNQLLTQHNIACVPGIAFGQEGYIRMAFCEQEERIQEGLLALHKATSC